MNAVVQERLISADSHANFTKQWVYERAPKSLHQPWDEAIAKYDKFAEEQRKGSPQLQMEDFVDLEAVRDPGWSDPHARLRAMDRDGVEAELIFPDFGSVLPAAAPSFMGDNWKQATTVYNNAMADFASVDRNRLLCAYQLPLYDIDFAVNEVQRLAKLGARGMQVHPFPTEHGVPDYHDKRYTRLWSALEETGIAALNHLALKTSLQEIFHRDPTPQKGIYTSLPSMALAETLAFWILTGTLERHPKLKVVLVEPGLGWLPWYLGILDGRMHQHYEFPGVELLPSEYFKRQVRATFMYEPEGLALCYQKFGPGSLLWSTDFPHPATCWPHSQKQVKSQFAEAGIPEADRRKIVCNNAAQAFNV